MRREAEGYKAKGVSWSKQSSLAEDHREVAGRPPGQTDQEQVRSLLQAKYRHLKGIRTPEGSVGRRLN